MPFPTPIPPSPSTSTALLQAFAERDIEFVPGRPVASVDVARSVAVLADGTEVPYDLFLGVPKHRAPDVVIESGMAVDGYIPVDGPHARNAVPGRLRGRRRRDGRDAEGGRLLGAPGPGRRPHADRSRARGESAERYDGRGSCYIEFGSGLVARIDVDFFSAEDPTGTFREPSTEFVAEKAEFGSSRRARWFGLGT